MDILKFLEKNQDKFIWNYVLIPIRYLLELYCFSKYNKFILKELIENDDIFDYLDRNDFEYNGRKLFKTDLVDEIEFLSTKSDEEAKKEIQKDFTFSFSELIEKHTNFDIENYLSLTVKIESSIFEIDSKTSKFERVRLYTVNIQFIRLWYLEKFEKRFAIFMIILMLLILITFTLRYLFI